MATVYNQISHFLNEYADPRTSEWPLVGSLVPLSIMIVSYLYFVLKVGPEYMKERKPYDLKLAISLYNIAQVFACIYIFSELLAAGWWNDYSLRCYPTITTTDPKPMRMANVCWWTMILKLSEFLETIFFVLRKKSNQITTLHLYHHVSTLLMSWICVKYEPGGMTSFPIMPNCLVHILMYSYYLASLHAGNELQKKLNKWKRYLTMIQMIQFCVILGHAFQAFVPSCRVNRAVVWAFVSNVSVFFYMFYDFYQKSYNKTKKQK